jgi:hypothetical protein
MASLLTLSSLVYPSRLLTKRISAASRPFLSRFVVTHVSLLYSSVGLATTMLKTGIGQRVQMFTNKPDIQNISIRNK